MSHKLFVSNIQAQFP